jgi:hypothetical protein
MWPLPGGAGAVEAHLVGLGENGALEIAAPEEEDMRRGFDEPVGVLLPPMRAGGNGTGGLENGFEEGLAAPAAAGEDAAQMGGIGFHAHCDRPDRNSAALKVLEDEGGSHVVRVLSGD